MAGKRFGGGAENFITRPSTRSTRRTSAKLKVAWTYESGDAYPGSEIQCNPIVVGGVMYTTTPKLRVVALDAATGKEIWSFDGLKGRRPTHKSRGLTHWTDGKQSRILFGLDYDFCSHSMRRRASSIRPLGTRAASTCAQPSTALDQLTLSVPTPGAIYKDLIILGSSVPEQHPSTPGDIRAYNVRTGKLAWTFHTVPRPGEFGYDTWPKDAWKHSGGANNWAGLVVDRSADSCSFPRARRHSTSTAPIVTATTCSRTRSFV